jgi:hypothetical protein
MDQEQLYKYMASIISPEEKERLQKIGEKFYESFDIQNKTVFSVPDTPQDPKCINLEECLAHLVDQLRSGLHPRYLTEEEKHLVRSGYGDEWYKTYGWDLSDAEETI